jgi:transcriptional regulator with XRE-family HTH domain
VVSDDLRAVFGRRVRELRLGLRLSQEELAERADLHRNYIGGIERGERNVGVLNIGKLADALGVSLAEMFNPLAQRPRRRRS